MNYGASLNSEDKSFNVISYFDFFNKALKSLKQNLFRLKEDSIEDFRVSICKALGLSTCEEESEEDDDIFCFSQDELDAILADS